MPQFGRRSLERLSQCDERLQRILQRAIKLYDFTILTGHRTEEEQNKAYSQGASKLQWPHSQHNNLPSLAVDVAPWPIDWYDKNRFFFLAGVLLTLAKEEGVELRWGGDWDGDRDFKDQTFNDLPHFEIKETL